MDELGLSDSTRIKSSKSKARLTLNILEDENTDGDGEGEGNGEGHGEGEGEGMLRSMKMLGSWRGSKSNKKVQPDSEVEKGAKGDDNV